PLIVGWHGERIAWHYGFGAAGVGMVIGLVQYRLTESRLGAVGLSTEKSSKGDDTGTRSLIRVGVDARMVMLGTLVWLLVTGLIEIDPVALANGSAYAIVGAFVVYFLYLFIFEELKTDEKKKITALFVLFIFAALFWSGFEQAGSSLNLFADRYT